MSVEFHLKLGLVGIAQMVRASDCGPEGRRFNPDYPPHQN